MSSSQQRRLTQQINLGLTPDEAAAVDAAALSIGISRAALARRHLLASVGRADTTLPRRSTAMPPSDVAAAAALSGQLGRAAGATIQLAKALRTSPAAGHLHSQAELVLADLRRQAIEVATIVERLK
jgi:hypothetical protein